jgi:hypothetical protein
MSTTTENRVQGWINGVSIQMYVSDCPNCGVVYGITRAYELRRREDGKGFYCPNGHNGSFGESEIDKAKRLQVMAEGRERTARIRASAAYDQAEAAHHSARAYKGHLTRMRNRIASGVCPVQGCRRNFANVKAHVTSQHPTWAHEHPEALT